MQNLEKYGAIQKAVREILAQLPPDATLVAAAKTRTPEEALAAFEAGVQIIGHNYIQEAEAMKAVLGDRVRWHFIGHLQKNKANKAAMLFDMVETLDSLEIAERLDAACGKIGKTMAVLVEINSGREEAKSGVFPEEAEKVCRGIAGLKNLRLEGLMTMGPFTGNPEDSRPYFRVTRELRDMIARSGIEGISMKKLSMGMSDSWRVALEEGATMVRIGTLLFGSR